MSKKLMNLCLAALMGMSSTAAWALSEVGGVYQIGTADDLKAFAELVNAGNTKVSAVLTADIDKGMDLTMIGCDAFPFDGTFDGAGHTITVDAYPEEVGCAIFRNNSYNALVKDLKVQGTITTSQQEAAGIVVWNDGEVRGCWVDLTIKSAVSGEGTHAGIAAVGYQGSRIQDCLVQIKLDGATTTNCGGLNGRADNCVNVTNCLVIDEGSEFKVDGNSGTVSRNPGQLHLVFSDVDKDKYIEDPYSNRPGGASTNNYAITAWGNTKCVEMTTRDELATGKICYQLNHDQSRIAWVQEIGVDAFPVPAAFGSKQVYASGATDCTGKGEDLTYSNSGTVQASAHTYDKYGVCLECGHFDFQCLERDPADGYYLLKTAADIDLAEGFSRLSNGGRFSLKMAADIEYTAEPGRFIFNTSNWFDGSFNGDGHSLTYEISDITENNASLFPEFAGKKFENVILHGSITTTGQYAGSITAHTRRDRVHISNVYSDMTINTTHSGDNTSAGLIGVVESKTWVDNTIYAGDVNGVDGVTECLAGFAGWASGQTYYTNCAFLGTLNGAIGESYVLSRNPGNVITDNVYWIDDFGVNHNAEEGNEKIEDPEMIESGELAYLLNGAQGGVDRFYQKIGEDVMPMPFKKEGGLIYAAASEYRCDGRPIGETQYSNTDPGSMTLPDHQYEDGFCAECGNMDPDYITPAEDGWFELSNGAELTWWSNYAVTHLGSCARLTADIDMDGYCEKYANIGTQGAPFYGCFDGQYHKISNFILDRPGVSGVGLIAVMNSLPATNKDENGNTVSDDEARSAEGVYIKNVTLDETCAITGYGYVALVGMTAGWAGHVNISGVMMEGDVTAVGGPNAAGVFGCVMSSTCHVTIDNCGMTGNVYGPKENGSFSGWLGSYAEVTNCFAVGSVEGIESDARYFARLNSATITNCYAKYGTQVPLVSDEDFESGALAWKANGEQFRTGYWYQTIGEDPYPYADPSHGTVIYAAEQYFSVANDEDLDEVIAAVQEYIHTDLDEAIATDSLLQDCIAAVDALEEVTSIAELADAFDALAKKESDVKANETIYKAYIAEIEKTKAYLAEHEVPGALAQSLEYYLTENDEPSEENELGTYEYIIENHTATGDQIKAETQRVIKWLADAIAEDYQVGADVTALLANADFSQGISQGWSGKLSTGSGKLKTEDEAAAKIVGVEAWNVTGDMYQTAENMKPGYYLVGISGAYRPSDDRYTYNYGAGIYANGNFNFFPTVIEDYVTVENAEDQVNCNLAGDGALDLAIYDDYISTSEEDGATLLGYAVHGTSGIAAAANAGRYPVYTIALVGEDGKLTVGIKNPGSHYGSDWTGWSGLKVTYCGDEAEEAMATVIENMTARANTILTSYVPNEVTDASYKKAPCYPSELKAALESAVAAATTAEDKMAAIATYSQLFQDIYAGKQAYIHLSNVALDLQYAEGGNLELVEKDEESGEWIATGEMLFTSEQTEALYTAGDELLEAYMAGSYTTAQAEAAVYEGLEDIIAPQDSTEAYLISNPKQLAYFRAVSSNRDYTVCAKLQNNIDMSGIAMQPINQWNYSYRGSFDGQGYAIENVYINFTDTDQGRCGLFNTLDGATVKNLKITGEYYSDGKFIGGVCGNAYGAKIDNVETHITMYSGISGDGTHGGIVGNNAGDGTVISNCLIANKLIGEKTNSCGGVIGWSGSTSEVKNTLILSEFNIDSSSCDIISRNGDNCTKSNNYYLYNMDGSAGSVTTEQLASGEIAYKLNGSQSKTPVWFQTIGSDATPVLFDGATVYYYGGNYINEVPDPQLNAYAYNVTAWNGGVKYTLNAKAVSVKARFENGNEVTIGENLTAGTYTAKVDGEAVALVVEGTGTLEPVRMDSYAVASPYGLAVNNNPASKNFGQVLMTEARPLDKFEGTVGEENPAALYAFGADFEYVGAYYGGLQIAGQTPLAISGDYQFDLKDLRFSKDGRLFVARASGLTNSSVYEINPEDLTADWSPIFKGGELDEATGITYVGGEEQNRMAVSIAVEGEGENLKLYVLGAQRTDGNANTTDYNCSIYNLGTATEWTGVPSASYEALNGVYTQAPGHVGIHEDGQGGLWYMQHVSSPAAEQPAIKHYAADGTENYSDIKTDTKSGKMAITADGNYLAIPMGSNKVVIYETNYVPMANGKIYLNAKSTITTNENNITGIDFDIAGNLYAVSSGSKTLSRYAIPSLTNNITVTEVHFHGMAGDVNGDSEIDVADIECVLDAIANKEASKYAATADVNGDSEIDVADIECVLSIIANK